MSIDISPIPRALVPATPDAAQEISAPNYDEFQDDREVREELREHPDSVLKVTMAHCDTDSPSATLEADSKEALKRAGENMCALVGSDRTREVENLLFIYEITGPQNRDVRQIGLGGMARTDQIRTGDNPDGPIIRNEGIREAKARGRADLIRACGAIIGTVNNAVPDETGALARQLELHADMHPSAARVQDGHGNLHRVWHLTRPDLIEKFTALLARESEAYVADGNHRSAAAAMLGHPQFLTVFFTVDRMSISPYNRLISGTSRETEELEEELARFFEIGGSTSERPYQPECLHQVGLYTTGTGWYHLRIFPEHRGGDDAVASLDHHIVQHTLFREVFGIEDAADSRLRFVGANRDARWLQEQVDSGDAKFAVTLPAVRMAQFVAVCRQNGMMPPKSTWFEPKLRSGLVMALLDSN